MKNILLPPLLSIATYNCLGQQSNYPWLKGDTLFVAPKVYVVRNDMAKIGTGSAPDGDFKFIRVNSASIFNYYSTSGYQGLANAANALSRSSAGLSYKVVRNEQRGNKKHGYVFYIVISVGGIRYEVDVMNALKAGEFILDGYEVPNNNKTIFIQTSSKADEIEKFKKLRDDGTITEEEFQQQKRKILND